MASCWSGRYGHNQEAAYLWTTPVGNVIPLCVSCCAWWRWNARDDPALRPLRIDDILADHDRAPEAQP